MKNYISAKNAGLSILIKNGQKNVKLGVKSIKVVI